MSAFDKEVRYGIRALGRSPGFALVAVASLALGIGANTTIFSVANAVLYRPLPFEHPDGLVVIHEQNTKREGWQRSPLLSTMIEWQEWARSFEQIEGIVVYAEANTLSGERMAERVTIQFLTPAAFSAEALTLTYSEWVPGYWRSGVDHASFCSFED